MSESLTPSPNRGLESAKSAFRSSVLQNDTLFSILQSRLQKTDSLDASLPDFGVEPTIRRNNDGTSVIGLKISRSATATNGPVTAHVGVFDYLPLGRMNTTTGVTEVTPELETALTTVGKEKQDGLAVLQAWQAGINEMATEFPDPIAIDPMTGSFELESELSSLKYRNDSLHKFPES